MVPYQAIAWFALESDAASPRTLPACCAPPRSAFGDHPAYVEGDRDAVLRRPAATGSRDRRAATSRSGSARRPGRALGARTASTGRSPRWPSSYAGGVLVPVNSPLHRARGGRRRRAHRRAAGRGRHDGFLGRTQIADLRAAGDLASVLRGDRHRRPGPTVSADPADDRRRRRRRWPPTTSPTSCSPPAPPAGPKGAMSAHRQTIGVARAWAELGGVTAGRPLPGGQPVLPLLRLQDRHRRRAAHRRDALPGRDLRRRRDDAR